MANIVRSAAQARISLIEELMSIMEDAFILDVAEDAIKGFLVAMAERWPIPQLDAAITTLDSAIRDEISDIKMSADESGNPLSAV